MKVSGKRTTCLITGITLIQDQILSDQENEFIYIYPKNAGVKICFTDYSMGKYDETSSDSQLLERLMQIMGVEVSKFITARNPSEQNPELLIFDNEWMMILISDAKFQMK